LIKYYINMEYLLNKILFSLIVIFFICEGNLYSQNNYLINQKYYLIKIYFDQNFTLENAIKMGLDLESAEIKNNKYIELIVNNFEMDEIQKKNLKSEIIIDDIISSVRYPKDKYKLSKSRILSGTNFKLGSMGGFYTYQEIDEQYSLMKIKFPQYFKKTVEIGRTYQNHPIYAFCFGNCDENKPQVLFTALHHAREPGGLMVLTCFLWDLMEKANAGDYEANYLLNNREIWAIPIINIDGYLINQREWEANNEKRGLWRKNASINSNGSIGVDLNRNYGPLSFWELDMTETAIDPSKETYHGSAPFSEPETQAIRDFCRAKNFKTAVNYHTFGRHLIYPFSALMQETNDSALYRGYASYLTRENLYNFGTDQQTIGYSAVGCSDDWLYFPEDKKPKIIAITPEIGNKTDNFWPPPDRTLSHCFEFLRMNYEATWSGGVNIRPVDYFVRYVVSEGQAYLFLTLQNIGTMNADSIYKITITPLSKYITVFYPDRDINKLHPGEKQIDTFEISISDGKNNGDYKQFELSISGNGFTRKDTLKLQLYEYSYFSLFTYQNDFFEKWNPGLWGLELDTLTNSYILTDSPKKNYYNDTANYIELKDAYMVKLPHETLEFETRWQIEWDWDVAVIQVSTDDGNSWKYFRTNRMVEGYELKDSKIGKDVVGFSGNYPEWVRQECSLDPLFGKKIRLRLGLLADASKNKEGWYIRNMLIRQYPDSTDSSKMEKINFQNMRVYPIPVNKGKKLIVDFNTDLNYIDQDIKIRIYDIMGRMFYDDIIRLNIIPQNKINIDTYFLDEGVYKIEIYIRNNVYSSKFIVAGF
jgi:carboxypeptidase T